MNRTNPQESEKWVRQRRAGRDLDLQLCSGIAISFTLENRLHARSEKSLISFRGNVFSTHSVVIKTS